MIEEKSYNILSNFMLKIFGIISMTFDHVGLFLQKYENMQEFAYILRILGRLAFPIFIFLLVEGILHTKSIRNYFVRLGILAAIFLIGQVIYFYKIDGSIRDFYSPMIDLLLVGSTIYLINRKDKFSFISIATIGYIILSFVVMNIEFKNNTNIKWLPFYIRPAYSIYGLLLGLGFYFSKKLAKIFLENNSQLLTLLGTTYEVKVANIFAALSVLVPTLIFYIIYSITGVTYFNSPLLCFNALAFLPILLYSGKRGYDSKWFRIASYSYVPLHLVLIFIIFNLI